MILTGVIINLAAIVLGSAAGLLLKKGIPDRMGESVLKAMALCVIYIGISGTLDGENILIAIISMAVGTIIGEALSLQQRLEQLGGFIQSKCRPSVSAIVLASSLGIGVMFSGVLCFLYEGIITVCARFIGPYLTTSVINEMTCVGSLLIIAVGINMLFKNKIRVMNSIPAVFLPILLCRIM